MALIVALVTAPLHAQVQTQLQRAQIDYAKRELQAPPAIKQQLQTLRMEIQTKNLKFQVGYTTALDYKIEQITGGKPPVDLADQSRKQLEKADELLKIDMAARDEFLKINKSVILPEFEIKCVAGASSWDWRLKKKVTPVRDQKGCGSCWAFAAIGAYEANYLIRNNESIDASEQCALNCSGAGGCGGGWYNGVFEWLIKNGTATETSYPYTANDKPCSTAVPTPYRAVAWGVVHPESPIPTVAQIKEALCKYGPLAIGVLVTSDFQAYTGGVFNHPASALTVTGDDGKKYWNVNHCVTLIGWDDSKHAWLIKNSWGTAWGDTCGYGSEKGYMWIDYGSSNVGLFPAWVQAKNKFYIVDISKFKKLYEVVKPFPPYDPGVVRQLKTRSR